MQKKVIALAVAGLVSGAAFAQSNVTIYGVADIAYTYSKGDSGFTQNDAGVPTQVSSTAGYSSTRKFSGLNNGGWAGSRVGFKGEEALGNGLKAIFTLEFGTAVDTDDGLKGTRQSWVGVDTQYGSFTAGRQYAPSWLQMPRNAAFEATNTTPLSNFVNTGAAAGGIAALGGTMTTIGSARWNNSVVYQSANFGGFSSRVIYAFGETGNTTNIKYDKAGSSTLDTVTANTATVKTTDNGKFGISLNYANGPFNIDAIYQAQLNVRSTYPDNVANAVAWNNEGKDINEWYIGGAYDFGAVKVMANYQTLKNKNDTVTATRADARIWSMGAIVPVSAAGKVRFEYANMKFNQSDDTGVAAALQKDGSTSGFGVGYTHELSKRTMLYTTLTRMNNDKDSMDIGGNGNGVGVRGESNLSFTAGVNHKF